MKCCDISKAKQDVKDVLKELVLGIAQAVLTGDTGDLKFPGGFDVDISMKDNASATKFDVFGEITLKFLDSGKEVDVKISRQETN